MDSKSEQPKDTETNLLALPNRTRIGRVFAGFRLTFFIVLILGVLLAFLPLDNLISSWEGRGLWFLILGGVMGAIFLGALFYFIFAPGSSPTISAVFNFEPIAAVALGIIAMFFIGILTIFNASPSLPVVSGMVLMLMYLFYVYRLIRETFKIQKENYEIRKKYGELIEVDKEKADFIMVTSHQLRTPLTEIRWSLDLVLRQGTLEEKLKSILKKNLESATRLATIVDEMLKTRAFEVKNHVLKKETVDVVKLLSDIVVSRDLLAEQKGVALSFEPPEKTVNLYVDKEKMRIALENIVDNAVRYSPNGKVHVTIGTEGGKVKIVVDDTGIGIDVADQKRIFTKFFRAKNALLAQPDGSGIGLYATKNIVEQHGGTISFFSELGKGTKFIITLALAK